MPYFHNGKKKMLYPKKLGGYTAKSQISMFFKEVNPGGKKGCVYSKKKRYSRRRGKRECVYPRPGGELKTEEQKEKKGGNPGTHCRGRLDQGFATPFNGGRGEEGTF